MEPQHTAMAGHKPVCRTQSKDRPPTMSDLKIVLLGKSVSENSSVGNFLLGRAAFDSEAPPGVVERVRGRLKDRHVTIISSPQLLQTNISWYQRRQTVRECVYLSDPGPHVIVLLLKHDQCSTEDHECVEKVLGSFSERIFQHSMVLTTQEPSKTNAVLQKSIQKCANRHFSLQRSSSPDDLLQMFEDIVHMNNGHHLVCTEFEGSSYFIMKQQAIKRHGVKLNLVVCGSDGTLKSFISEQILQQTDRRSDVELHGHQISLVELPALFNIRRSEEEVMRQTLHCVSLCHPEVHVFLLIIPDAQLNNEDKAEMEEIQKIFSSRINKHIMILIMQDSEHQTEELNAETQSVIESFGGRHHFFGPSTQVSTLMENIEQMVEQNSEGFFSMETFLEAQMKKLLQFEEMKRKISSLEKHILSKSSAESKDDLRRVLLRKGVCANGNSIRNEEKIREVGFRREIPKQEAYQRKIRDEMRREQETLKHDMEEMRQEKEELQIKYDTEIDRLINMIENVKKREEQYKLEINEKEKKESEIQDEMKRERDEWERQKLEERQRKEEDEKRREREKHTSDEQFQRLKSEMEGIIRENERIERERQEQLKEFEKRLKKESEMRENQQQAFKETLKLLEEKQTRRVEWTEYEREKNKICSETNDSLQVIAYRKLESEYSKWSWSLHSAIMKTENKLLHHIENQAMCKVEETDLQKELQETRKKVEKSMSEFFEKDKNKDIPLQWKTSCEIKIKELQENIVRETKRKLTEVLQQRDLKKKIGVQRTQHENTLYEKSKELALKLKDKISDKETLNKEFDLFWEQWMRKIITDTGPIEDTDIMRDVREILSDVHDAVPIDHKKWRDMFCVSNYSDYVWLKRFSGLTGILTNVYKSAKENLSDFLSKEDKDQITSFISDVALQTDTMVQLFDISKMGYNISCIQQLIGYIKRRVTEHQEGPVKYVFKNEFFIDLVYTICNKANKIITDEHRMFMEDNDPLLCLEEKRKEYYSIFQKHLNGATSAAIFGEIICQKLKEPIKQSLYKKTARDLTDDLMTNCETLKGNRSKLEKHILKLLAENENFSAYMDYINYPRDHFKSFIRDEVSRYITSKFSASVLPKMKQNIMLLQQRIMKASHESNECVEENSGDVSLWLKSFTRQLSDVLIFSEEDLDGVKHDGVDCKLLKGVIKKVLPNIMSDISREFNIKTFNEKLKFKSKPDEILIDHLCRCCWAQCPFCKATCTNTIENHEGDHSVAFHRVRGINGTCYRFTQSLCADICTNLVANDQDICPSSGKISWKEIKITRPKYDMWSIIPGRSVLPYWKWFVCRFQKDLETYYNKTFECEGEIPYEWRTYTKQDAIESLDKYII